LGLGKTTNDQVDRIEELEHDANMRMLSGNVDVVDKVEGLVEDNRKFQNDFATLTVTMHDPSGELSLVHEQLNLRRASSKVGRGVDKHGVSFRHPSGIAHVLRPIGGTVTIFHDAVSFVGRTENTDCG
jgi:hypothetical protein